MAFHDVCNGDADGLFALRQLRLANPVDSILVTGIKRDIALLERVRANPLKGEITLLIGKAEESAEAAQQEVSPASIRDRVCALMQTEKLDEKSALKRVAKDLGISKSDAYRELQRTKA